MSKRVEEKIKPVKFSYTFNDHKRVETGWNRTVLKKENKNTECSV